MKPRVFKTEAGMAAFMASHAALGHAWHVLILHDNACSPNRCSCRPWYEVRPLTVETYLEGQRQQAKWIKETSS